MNTKIQRTDDSVYVKDLYEHGCRLLAAAGIEEARLDAWLLLEYLLNLSRADFYAHPEKTADPDAQAAYLRLVNERAKRRPLAQVTGECWFMGYPFAVNEHVLTPRQDTETLVLEALKVLPPSGRVLDVCTGSGCILISILLERKDARGTGCDLSGEALKTAQENARRHRLEDRAGWYLGDLFAVSALEGQVYDVIVSNPPYIPAAEIKDLMPEVSCHEPRMALDGGRDGLDFYRRIAAQADAFLTPGGRILCEIGYNQAEETCSLFSQNGWQDIQIVKDLSGHDRVISAQKK